MECGSGGGFLGQDARPWEPLPAAGAVAGSQLRAGRCGASSPHLCALSWAGGVLFQAGLGCPSACLSVRERDRHSVGPGWAGAQGGAADAHLWAAPTHFRGLSSGTFGRNTDGRAGLE